MVNEPLPVPAFAEKITTLDGAVGAVVIATGYTTWLVGLTQVEMQVTLGAEVEYAWVRLPLVHKVPLSFSVWVPWVKVVAESVTFHPLFVPV